MTPLLRGARVIGRKRPEWCCFCCHSANYSIGGKSLVVEMTRPLKASLPLYRELHVARRAPPQLALSFKHTPPTCCPLRLTQRPKVQNLSEKKPDAPWYEPKVWLMLPEMDSETLAVSQKGFVDEVMFRLDPKMPLPKPPSDPPVRKSLCCPRETQLGGEAAATLPLRRTTRCQ